MKKDVWASRGITMMLCCVTHLYVQFMIEPFAQLLVLCRMRCCKKHSSTRVETQQKMFLVSKARSPNRFFCLFH